MRAGVGARHQPGSIATDEDLPRRAPLGLASLVLDHLSKSRVAAGLDVSWSAANESILAEGVRQLIDDPARFDKVTTIGVDEHVWRHTRFGDKCVAVIIDLTPAHDKNGPARLLDMSEGRSKAVFKQWLTIHPKHWQDGIQVVVMDGFSGFRTATSAELPEAVIVMDPFHVIRLAGDALESCRRRAQYNIHGHRGRKGDPLYRARRTLLTGAALLTEKQQNRVEALFADERHVEVEAIWGVYQDMITAYREKDRRLGQFFLKHTIDRICDGVPAGMVEMRRLARTLKQRGGDVLRYFDRPGTSNGPTEAINGRLEHLRGTALRFRSLANYVVRSLLESGGFRPLLHPGS